MSEKYYDKVYRDQHCPQRFVSMPVSVSVSVSMHLELEMGTLWSGSLNEIALLTNALQFNARTSNKKPLVSRNCNRTGG